MGAATMGKVLVPAKIEYLGDLYDVKKGQLSGDKVRTIEVSDALVDTGATYLGLPRRLIQQLGLMPYTTRRMRTSAGPIQAQVYGTVRLTIQERDCTCDVLELPDECPVLIRQIPLEAVDFVVDPINQRVIGNPDHNGECMFDMF
jgi:predicted aspartyl protease